ncbi:MAG: MmgE/PrpD family protein [Rhodospirillales bacterium]
MSSSADLAQRLEGLTMKFAEFVANLHYEDLPADVVQKAKLHLRDGVGNQIAASAIGESAKHVIALAEEWGGARQSTVVGYGLKLPTPMAAMCNAMLGHGVELDDAHGSGLVKSGSVLVPSAFAIAEQTGASGKDVITAVVAAYEIAIRIAKAINPGHRQRGYHTTGTVSPFGAAALTAKLLGCDAEKTAWALGLAGMQSAGIQSYLADPCLAKPFSPGKAAFNGVLAGILASRGLSGPRTVLESHEGFFKAFTDQVKLEELDIDGLGDRFCLMEVGFKPHAACRYAHGPIDLAQSFHAEEGITIDDVDHAVSHMSELSIRQASKPVCANLNVAMGSTEFGVALGLDRGVNGLRSYWDGYKDKRLHEAAADKITLKAEPEFGVGGRQAVLEVTLKNGRVLKRRQEEPKGEPSNPLSPEQLEQKFMDMACIVLEENDAAKIGERLMTLETEANAGVVPAMTVVGSGKPALRAA